MLEQIRGTPRWADDPVRRQDGQFHRIGKETDSPSEGSRIQRGAEMGDGNSYVTISKISWVRSSY